MDEHIERTCAGLRKLESLDAIPDYILYLHEACDDIPEFISGVPILISSFYFGGFDLGLSCGLEYIPLYTKARLPDDYWGTIRAYLRAYEDYAG